MTAPTFYTSDDASAPSLSGTAGSMIALLDAILVTGYGAKAAAGWTKPYTGTNLAAYLMGAGGTSDQMYLRVDDTGTTQARVVGYETMSAVSVGTNAFPTNAQFPGGLYLNKSTAASATVRPWWCLATPTAFYLYVDTGTTTFGAAGQTYVGQLFFGEYTTYVGSFTQNVAIISGPQPGLDRAAPFGSRGFAVNDFTSGVGGQYLAREYTGVAGAVLFAKMVSAQWGNATSNQLMGTGFEMSVPEPVSGKVYVDRVKVFSAGRAVMGHLPGWWNPIVDGSLGNTQDTMDGSGSLAGRSFLHVDIAGAYNNASVANATGRALFALTDWD